VMMFVAGGFLWANLSEHPYWTRFTASKPLGPVDGASVSYGWPADCYIRLDEANVPPGVVPYNIGEFGLKYHDGAYYAQDAWGFWISINVVTAALGIVGTALVSEWLIRCREGRKP
jgi:hypothetical protein